MKKERTRFAMKRTAAMDEKATVRVPQTVVTFAADGMETLSCATKDLSAGMVAALIGHGIMAKVGDAAALPAGSTPAQKRAAMADVWENLINGRWNAVRESLTPEEKAARLESRVADAWMELTGKTAEAFEAAIAGKVSAMGGSVNRQAIIVSLAKQPKILAIMNRSESDLDVEDMI